MNKYYVIQFKGLVSDCLTDRVEANRTLSNRNNALYMNSSSFRLRESTKKERPVSGMTLSIAIEADKCL